MTAPIAARPFDAFDASPDPTALLAPDGVLIRANAAFRAAFRHWIGPGRAPWGRVVPPPYQNNLRRFDAPAPDGRLFAWSDQRLPDGASLISARDITSHAQAGDEAARAKTVLFATLTHELRTPLNGVLGMAGLLSQTKLEPSQASYVAAIRQSGELLLDLITEILDYSRLEAGAVALENQPFDPEAVVQDVAELLSTKAYDKGLELGVMIEAGVPLRVIGDDGRLRQILFNLAGNAIKFTETGGVTLKLSRKSSGALRFGVRDTGPGVPLEKQQLIFQEFAQADAGVARQHGGAGLGLSIVEKLARAMGGSVGIESQPGRGALFFVDLPLPECDGGASRPSLAGVRIGIANASDIAQRSLSASLSALGASICNGHGACDVVLLDWRSDYSAEEIAEFKRYARIVIALIAQEQRDAIKRARDAGADHYILKPVRRRALAERILGACDAAGAQPAWTAEEHIQAPSQTEPARVLLAEDNPINALLARALLSRMNCMVDCVQDGAEAVAAVAAAPYDVILLDLRMPRLDGFAAAEQIRKLPGPAGKTPLVALTADAGEAERAQALAAGMDDFLTKPIDSARLADVIERFTTGAKAASL